MNILEEVQLDVKLAEIYVDHGFRYFTHDCKLRMHIWVRTKCLCCVTQMSASHTKIFSAPQAIESSSQ